MTYFTNAAKAKRKAGDDSFMLNAARKGNKQQPELPPMARAIGMGIKIPKAKAPEEDKELQSALDANRSEAEKLAAKRNVRRASSRQLLSSSRLETLGQGD